MQAIDKQRNTPKQKRSRLTIGYILEAATQLLQKPSAQGFTTNHIADRAGISIGTLYRYFPDKDSLMKSLVLREIKTRSAEVSVIMEDASICSGEELIERVVECSLTAFDGRAMVRKNLLKLIVEKESTLSIIENQRDNLFQQLEHRLVTLEPDRYRHMHEDERRSLNISTLGMINNLAQSAPELLNTEHTKQMLVQIITHSVTRD